jgi:hypothetical protein
MENEAKDSLASKRGDFYHQGVVTKLFPSNNTGVVRTESGRELTFSYELVIICGEAKSALDLKVGDPVGYDLPDRRRHPPDSAADRRDRLG